MGSENRDLDVSRRTLMKAAGAVAGAGLLGAGAGTAAAAPGVDRELLNWRTVEARKVWARGYRGRPDRALALTDSGISARHADLAPWNNVIFRPECTGDSIEVKRSEREVKDVPVPTLETDRVEEFSGVLAGAGAVGFLQRTDFFTLEDPTVGTEPEEREFDTVERSFSGLTAPAFGVLGFSQNTEPFAFDAPEFDREVVDHRIDATLTWEPSNEDGTEPNDMDLEIQKRTDGGWSKVAESGRGGVETQSENEERVVATGDDGVTDDTDYRFVVYNWRGAETEWRVDATLEVLLAPESDGDTTSDLVDPGFRIDATLTWNRDHPGPQHASVEMVLQNRECGAVASAGGGGLDVSEDNEATLSATVPGGDYRFQVTTWRGAAQWEIDAEVVLRKKQYDEDGNLVTETREVTELTDVTEDIMPSPGEVDGETPKVVGWWDAGPRFGNFPERPRDRNGHGSHVSGIMAGTGRGSVVDRANTEVHEPRAVLLPGDFIEYDVDVPATGSAFASAIGTGVVVEIVGPDDRTIHTSPMRGDSTVADEPAVHESGTKTYTVRVKPYETEEATDAAAERAQSGTPTAGRVQRIAVGTYRDADGVTGERVEDGEQAVHPGLAPNQSLVGMGGLGTPTNALNEIADDLAATFNVRAVNMSWGPVGGVPIGMFGGVVSGLFGDRILSGVRSAAEAGILTVAAAGNAFTPANGNGYPAVADEAVSVVATGPLDGITSYSSGGIGALDEDENRIYMKPDVTAPGGDVEPDAVGAIAVGTADREVPVGLNYPVPSQYELVRSVRAADPDAEVADFEPRDYASFGGTSMASPYVCGTVGLVAQAMEEAAPASIALPAPADAAFEDVMRLKQAVLATATETAFTAAPYHTAKNVPSTPTYDHGGRDPYEGFGRVNPDAAVDAVSRDLFADATAPTDTPPEETTTATLSGAVGLNVPFDSRAVAGYVEAADGSFDASVDVSHLSGGNRGMAKGAPHVDLFVYDAENPAADGEPNVVASDMGTRGSASVSVDVATGDDGTHVHYVVAKLVNVPGVVNGFDVQAHLDIGVEFTAAALPEFEATGTREDDASAFTGGQTDRVELTVEDVTELAADDGVTVTDAIPEEWTFLTGYVRDDDGNKVREDVTREGTTVDFGTFEVGRLRDEDLRFVYFVQAPEGVEKTRAYTFGPAELGLVTEAPVSNESDTFGGTDTNTVVGASTSV